LLLWAAVAALSPASLHACACGCGIFDVGTSAMMPNQQGGWAYLEVNHLNQDKNWHEHSRAPHEDNEDKQIRSEFFTAGVQYMFNRSWGTMLDVPYWRRHFETTNEDDEIVGFDHSALGDIRLRAVYAGFSPEMTSGITFGVKFPSGDDSYEHFDRDTQIGTGSTDVLLGAYHRGLIASNNDWNWFVNGQADLPVLITPNYRPGDEVNATLGAYYNGWKLGHVKVAPLAQMIGSVRWSDTGDDAAHDDSGYKRVVLSPGIEFSTSHWRVYGDVGLPVYQYVNGQQLVASELYKVNVARRF
jgi:hypothetical protein